MGGPVSIGNDPGVLRVANCSGFYGDRISAMREVIEDGPIDVVCGDYLAELTMLILGRDQMRDPTLGYARTFVRQVTECLELAKSRGIRIVSNAGGLNPAGLTAKLRGVAADRGVDTRVAYVDGDNLIDRAAELGLGEPLTANAYLGAFGIARALDEGADIVVTGRVTDASIAVGPAIAHFGWGRDDFDRLAGAVIAGHVIECGTQATGGNFSGFRQLDEAKLANPHAPLGFPIAEIAEDGSCVITKHPGTNGAVTVDTVTAQLMYEIGSTLYLGPDVTTHLDSLRVGQQTRDRVAITGATGAPPPATLKVCVNELGGYRNEAEFVLVGLDIDAKADWVRDQVETALTRRPATIQWALARTDHQDAGTEEAASARLRLSVKDPSPEVVGKGFTAPLVELALGSYPGFFLTGPPRPASAYGVYRAASVGQPDVLHAVHHHDGRVETIAAPARAASPPEVPPPSGGGSRQADGPGRAEGAGWAGLDALRVPLGTIVHARSGDKGGDANIGLWAFAAATRADRVGWLLNTITPAAIRTLLPEAGGLDVEVYPLPNLGGVNVVIRGLLGDGVAASTRFDPQAKGLGEWIRSRHIDIPKELL